MPRSKPVPEIPQHRFNFVLPRALFDALSEMAAKNRRSTTSQLVHLLERATKEEAEYGKNEPTGAIR